MHREGVLAMGRGFMICGFIVNAPGRGFEKKPFGLDLRHNLHNFATTNYSVMLKWL